MFLYYLPHFQVMSPARIEVENSVAFLDSFEHGLHDRWSVSTQTKNSEKKYVAKHVNGTLHFDGRKVVTNEPLKAILRKSVLKYLRESEWVELHFDFRVTSNMPSETNIHVEIINPDATSTPVFQKRIFSGDDKSSLHKFRKSTKTDSGWQSYTVDMTRQVIKDISNLRIQIFTLQNSFRPLKQMSIRNVFLLRTALPGEMQHHLPDGHAEKVIP